MKVLIVDDEPLAREVIAQLLAKHDDVDVVGEAGSGEDAIEKIRALQPDLVFLDVQMPGCDGFGVLRAVGPDAIPQVIFATAFDEHALRAFEVHAVDYLIKPFRDERFEKALARAKEVHQSTKRSDLAQRLMELVAESGARPSQDQHFAIKSGGTVYFLDVEEIDWIEAANNSVRFHAGGKRHLMRATISSIESQLDEHDFARIHRSTIVRLDRIRKLVPQEHGDYLVVLRAGTELRMSRRRREELRARLPC
jgi:two-component system LytT family response regulator